MQNVCFRIRTLRYLLYLINEVLFSCNKIIATIVAMKLSTVLQSVSPFSRQCKCKPWRRPRYCCDRFANASFTDWHLTLFSTGVASCCDINDTYKIVTKNQNRMALVTCTYSARYPKTRWKPRDGRKRPYYKSWTSSILYRLVWLDRK